MKVQNCWIVFLMTLRSMMAKNTSKKDVPAYHIDNNTFNTQTAEPKPTTYEEMTDDELDKQYEELKRQREERRKRRKEKDFEM